MTPLTSKPLRRRVGNLVVEVDREGITLRRYRGRKRLVFRWEQVATLATADSAILAADEVAVGGAVLRELMGECFRPATTKKRDRATRAERKKTRSTSRPCHT